MFNLYRKKLYVSKININKYITRSFQNASVIKKFASNFNLIRLIKLAEKKVMKLI